MQDGQTTTSEDRATKLDLWSAEFRNCQKELSRNVQMLVRPCLLITQWIFHPLITIVANHCSNNGLVMTHRSSPLAMYSWRQCLSCVFGNRHLPLFSWPPPAVNTVLQNFAWWCSGRMCKKRHFTLIVGQLGKGKLTDCSHYGNHTVSWLKRP